MFKKYFAVIFVCLITVFSFAQGNEEEFRGVMWGASINEIKDKSPDVIERYAYHYVVDKKINLNNYVAQPFFFVVNKKMICGGYIFEVGDNDAFEAIDEALEKKYGETDVMDERFYKRGRNFSQGFDVQFAKGNLYYLSQWDLAKMTIFHAQEVIDESIIHRVYYCSLELAGREYEKLNLAALEDQKDEL